MDEHVEMLMRANLHRVFGERDAGRRAEAVRETYAPDVVFADEDGSVTGHHAIAARARELLDRVPGDFAFFEDGPVYGTAGRAALAWRFGPPGGEPVARGLDIATIADERIVSLETLVVR
jgi:beta-phosphoglucomutase-like phosphatase (HAD superfamily)